MTTIDLKGLRKVTAKGRTYYYAWRGKGAPRLKSEPGTDAFAAEYAAALELRRAGHDTGRMAGVVAAYKASDDYCQLAPKTRQNWGPWLDRIAAHFGALRMAHFDQPYIRRDIKKWRARWKDTPRTADMGLQVLSRVLSYAVENGEIAANPCAGIPHLYRSDRSDLIWTDVDLAALRKVASKELMWAADLAALTGLRQGDLLRLSWSHVGEHAIEMRTAKSGGRRTALIPLYAELQAVLGSIPKRATTVLTNRRAKPWQGGFRSSWQKACARAGITELHFHDLRGTAATRLYRADLSIREIAEILGWAEDHVERIITRYVKRDELLRDRIRRIDRTAQERVGGKPVENRERE